MLMTSCEANSGRGGGGLKKMPPRLLTLLTSRFRE